MPWIRTVGVEAATGRLDGSYRAAVERAGRVFGIVRTMSVQPHDATTDLERHAVTDTCEASWLDRRQDPEARRPPGGHTRIRPVP